MCLVGASFGAGIVLRFILRYPSYVSMICLLAPPGKFNEYIIYIFRSMIYILADKKSETNLIKQAYSGTYNALLPESPEELRAMINNVTVKKINPPRPFINGLFSLRESLLKEHAKGMTNHYKINDLK